MSAYFSGPLAPMRLWNGRGSPSQLLFCQVTPLAEREISFLGVPAEDVGETEWLELGPMLTPGAGTRVPAP